MVRDATTFLTLQLIFWLIMSCIESFTLDLVDTGGGVGRVVLGGSGMFGGPLAPVDGAFSGHFSAFGGPLNPAEGALGEPLGA
jgi:hypothetical protein